MSTSPRTSDSLAPEPRLTIYAGNRIETLVDRLAETMRREPLGPLEREVIVVQSRGMYRWLTLELAQRLDIAAGLATPFPAVFLRALMERIEGASRAGSTERYEPTRRSVFDPDLLTWRLFDLLGAANTDIGGQTAAYLRDDTDQQKRHQLAARLAERFDEYQQYRPDLIRAWEEHRQPITAADYRETAGWQAHLWRMIVETARSSEDVSPLARVRALLDRLQASAIETEHLPRRVHLFGSSTLPPLQLHAFTALARHVPVTFYVVEPTEQYWGDLVSEAAAERYGDRSERRGLARDDAHAEVGNRLLSALGRQGRDFHDLLLDADEHGSAWTPIGFEPAKRTTLLRNIQADIAQLIERRSPQDACDKRQGKSGEPGEDPISVPGGDRSLQIHVCHSPMREMEVLRDVLLDAFATQPDLRPHDVFVLAPDISAYAPYVEAVFGKDRRASDFIPFTIADRSPRYEQPVVEAATRVLALIGSRVTASAVIDLLDFDAIRRGAGIGAEEAATLRGWVRDANIRWGIDGEHRREFPGSAADDVDTWRAGLDRLLMGYAVAASDTVVSGILPLAGGAAEPDLLGRGLAFFDRLLAGVRRLHGARPLEVWAEELRSMLSELLAPDAEEERVALRALLAHVDELALGRDLAGVTEPVHIAVVRVHLDQRMNSTAGGAGFLTGGVTFCALKPLRAIPAKILCIVGLNEGTIPRLERRTSFDLMAVERRKGDRSSRDEDRYLFLESLLAARERLVLSYVGRSQKDNSELAPSILVSELLDYVERCARTDDGSSIRERLVIDHPLQPFSARYFTDTSATGTSLFSYSQENCIAAEAAADAEDAPALLCPSALIRADSPVLEAALKQLCDFFANPSRHFCREVLALRLPDDESDIEDDEPFTLDTLAQYKLVTRLVNRHLSGAAVTANEREAIRAAGEVPHAGFGRAYLHTLDDKARALAASVTRFSGPPPIAFAPHTVDLRGPNWRITGLLESVTARCLLRFRPAKIKPKDKLIMWIEHLVACALRASGNPSAAHLPVESLLIGTHTYVRLAAVEEPAAALDRLMAIYREGLGRPLPLFEAASFTFAERTRKQEQDGAKRPAKSGKAPLDWAIEMFRGTSGYAGGRGDVENAYVRLCTRDRDPLTEEAAEFERLARTLWMPFFAHATEERS